jgi:transcriptional regulator with XRE-family HTH domain
MTLSAPNALDLLVGQCVQEQRMQTGLSQEELSKALGITAQELQCYESGLTRIVTYRLHRIADLFNVPVTAFFEATGPFADRETPEVATTLCPARPASLPLGDGPIP